MTTVTSDISGSIDVGAPNRQAGARRFRKVFVRHAYAVLFVSLALMLTITLANKLGKTISPFFFVAVMFSAWFGLGPGLVATFLAAFFSAFYFMDPPGSLRVGVDDVVRLIMFLVAAIMISSMTALQRNTEAQLKLAQRDLEQRVRERTAELRATNESLQQEINERRRVEVELRLSEERFRLLIEGVKDYAIFMISPHGHVISWNAGAERISAFPAESITGQHFSCLFPPEQREAGQPEELLRTALKQGLCEHEGWLVRKDGSRFWATVGMTNLADEARNSRGFAVVMRDITERKEMEKAVLEISEREQRRIGHDLHDGLGQELTGVAFLSKVLSTKLAGQGLSEADEAARIADHINGAIRQTRELARGLYPVDLEVNGLVPALQQLATSVQSLFSVSCRVERIGPAWFGELTTASHLYRIAQEAINNAIRHGRARNIEIVLRNEPRMMSMLIQDDGIGLPADWAAHRGMGLHLMHYRARMIGAKVEVAPRDGSTGTRVCCTMRRNSPDQES